MKVGFIGPQPMRLSMNRLFDLATVLAVGAVVV
jgi:hypothetical protein